MVNVVELEKRVSVLETDESERLAKAMALGTLEDLRKRVEALEAKQSVVCRSPDAPEAAFVAEAVEASENMTEVLTTPRRGGKPRKSKA